MNEDRIRPFALVAAIAMFLVMLLAVTRLFRVAVVVFAVSAFLLLVWSVLLLRADDPEASPTPPRRRAKTPLQKQILKQLQICHAEQNRLRALIGNLERKAAYFVRRSLGNHVQQVPLHELLYQYTHLRSQYAAQVSPLVLMNCDKIVEQHQQHIQLAQTELAFWGTLEGRYAQAFDQMASAHLQIQKARKQLLREQKRQAHDQQLSQEMTRYLQQQLQHDEPQLENSLYQELLFSEVHQQVQAELHRLQHQLSQAEAQIEHLSLRQEQYLNLRRQTDAELSQPKANHLMEEIERIRQQIDQQTPKPSTQHDTGRTPNQA